MYPSGVWHGFWEQEFYGKQAMQAFELHFNADTVRGRGIDIVGPFRIMGRWDATNGGLSFVKFYLGKHQVYYEGRPEGEGCILGQWSIREKNHFGADTNILYQGNFLLQPVWPKPTGNEPIVDIG